MLVQKAQEGRQEGFHTDSLFSDLKLDSRLQKNIDLKGYESLTIIQEQAIPPLLEGRDIMAISRTGSGKTAAFLIPIILHALQDPGNFSALVVAPTRELAIQIGEEFVSLTKGMQLRSSTFIGGTNINGNLQQLKKKAHLIIGTPGRLLDLAAQRALDLRRTNTLVLDEFDRMLDMGFVNDVKKLVKLIGPRDQTMLFSATLDPGQKQLISGLLQDPVEIKVDTGGSPHQYIEQETIKVAEDDDKFEVLMKLFKNPDMEKIILFTETKRLADRIAKKLIKSGITAGQIHGDKSQNFRNKILKDFKSGDIRVLVATDVAARGIDVADVSHVINYQMPMTMDSYIHRIGRTGRAGKPGHAITFVN
ncbi:ATP-dependent RNA helicase RhlE [Echinicola pacifica]|uniref:ATP-dependent RNA helicase RhlE n=2 Tax=Echinicola pacifica TaxID=346377 RepID=A0A918UW74_9BACT|nr:ATP-dependent RNA helicase RhlE [Echinicola pacifica]